MKKIKKPEQISYPIKSQLQAASRTLQTWPRKKKSHNVLLEKMCNPIDFVLAALSLSLTLMLNTFDNSTNVVCGLKEEGNLPMCHVSHMSNLKSCNCFKHC